MSMQIFVNGDPREIPDGVTMTGLIRLLDLTDQRIAVEVNQELVPRSTFEQYRVQDQDRVEIVHAIGGG